MSNSELDILLARIKVQYAKIREGSSQQELFLANVRALADWEREPRDYPDVVVQFHEPLPIADSLCGVSSRLWDGTVHR